MVADTAAEVLETLPDVPSGTWDGAVMAFAAELMLLAEPKPMEVAAVSEAVAELEEAPVAREIVVAAVINTEELDVDAPGLSGIVEAPELRTIESALVEELPPKVILVVAVIAMAPDEVADEPCSGTPVGTVKLMADVEVPDDEAKLMKVAAVTAAEAVLVAAELARDICVCAVTAADELELEDDAPAEIVVRAVIEALLDDVLELTTKATIAGILITILLADVELAAPRATTVAAVTNAELEEVPADVARGITVAAVIRIDELLVDEPAPSGT